jgi:hypothetical protein
MKKILLTIAAIALFAAPASAQVYSLWADEAMTSCAVTTNPYTPFTIFVFLDPGPDGAFAAEYKLVGPAGHFSTANEKAAFVSGATIGVPFGAPGMAAPFLSCQSDLVWVWNVTCMGPTPDPGYYLLEPNDDSGNLGIAICPGDRPLADATLYNHFGYNDGCLVGTEESSWGAIKSLMD